MEYAELHAHTNFSLLDGTSDPEDMVECASGLALKALAITDHDSLSGIVRFAAAAKHHGVHAIVGVELTVAPSIPLTPLPPLPLRGEGESSRPRGSIPLSPGGRGARGEGKRHITLLAQDLTGYQNICALLTAAYRRGGKDNPYVPFDVLAQHTAGLIALSGCPQGELATALARGGCKAALEIADRYRSAFGHEQYYVELQHHALQTDGPRNAGLRAVAKALGIGCVATNNAHYHNTGRALLHHVVTCIRHQTTLEAAGTLLRGNDEYYLKSPAQMARIFGEAVRLAAEEGRPERDPIQNTVEIAQRCTFNLRDLRYEFPKPQIPSGESELSFLMRLVQAGKAVFYPNASPEVEQRLAHELAIVRQLDLAGYLLVFKEIVDWSHEQSILVSIRGSAPASALLYCLGLCPIDPGEHNLLFERFCSPERQEYPDIDLDFAHERREEVIQHVYEKYGRDYAAMVCEVNTYRIKSALRDIAKVLGLSAQRAQQLADQVDWHDADPRDRIVREDSGRMAELLISLSKQLLHSPRHRSIHVGGMVISSQPLANVAPIEPARMPNRTILPWDKDDLTLLAEEFGVQLIKMDLLGLGMLSVIGRCFGDVYELTGQRLRLHGFRYDERAFDVLCAADTVGLFQVESRAQQSFLPRLRPRDLSEVAISVGAIRPGPGAARAGEHIVRRRQGKEPITYPAPELRPPLEETYGVLLWQEQCIQVAVIAAGYTPGEADQLRRAMSHKRSYERMNALCQDLVARMLARGYPPRVADDVRQMIVGFAGYGFPRAHAYPFAHLALISATLRLRYPAAYYAAMLNCQPMGFYAPHTLVWDAHRHGVRVLPVDVNRSSWECTLERGLGGEGGVAIRLGFKEVHGLGPAAREVLERERAKGPFWSLADFVARTGFDRETLERLAEVGAFVSLVGNEDLPTRPLAHSGQGRRAAIWATGELAGFGEWHLPGLAEQVVEAADLAPMSDWEEAQADYRGIGFSIDRHIVEYFRPRLDNRGAVTADELHKLRRGSVVLRRGLVVRAGGLVIVRQRPETASNLLFLTLEDETGLLNAIVYPQTYERLRRVIRGEPLLVIEGPLQVQDGVTHILVRRAWPLTRHASIARVPSHDFH
ncbi:MAG: error-prone DNA polymerase [Chloroflexi bacterium]|nr:error-prone DNA polymerase [Chloroflexota bacterium]